MLSIATEELAEIWPGIEQYFDVDNDHITHRRITREIEIAQDRSRAGKLGGKQKASKRQAKGLAKRKQTP